MTRGGEGAASFPPFRRPGLDPGLGFFRFTRRRKDAKMAPRGATQGFTQRRGEARGDAEGLYLPSRLRGAEGAAPPPPASNPTLTVAKPSARRAPSIAWNRAPSRTRRSSAGPQKVTRRGERVPYCAQE